MSEDQPSLFEEEPPAPPVRYGPGRSIHPEVRRAREQYIQEALRNKKTWREIAEYWGVDILTVKKWHRNTYEESKYENIYDKERKCLSCGLMFWSEGPHNRMCMKCRGNRAYNPYEPGSHGTSGRQRGKG